MTCVPLTLLLLVLDTTPLAPGDYTRTVHVGGHKRTYHVHIPPDYDPKKPTPVVLVFHGAGINGRIMRAYCGLDRKADEASFLAVYPDGTGAAGTFLVWNAGGPTGWGQADDVAFVAALLDDLAKTANVDGKRVYATGISNGAMMAYRLAAELSDRIAAIAPVAGTMVVRKCAPARPVPVLHFHGTKDSLVPLAGLDKLPPWIPFRSVEGSVAAWVKVNGCKAEPETTLVADGKKDGLMVTRKTYAGGRDSAEVVLYVIEGGGHTWPGRPSLIDVFGKTARSISANDLMWDFFRRHARK
jgi:polyhydroxybutyrate depolymerase